MGHGPGGCSGCVPQRLGCEGTGCAVVEPGRQHFHSRLPGGLDDGRSPSTDGRFSQGQTEGGCRAEAGADWQTDRRLGPQTIRGDADQATKALLEWSTLAGPPCVRPERKSGPWKFCGASKLFWNKLEYLAADTGRLAEPAGDVGAELIGRFAWCGTSQSMSAPVRPLAASASSTASARRCTACRNTSLAVHRRWPVVPVDDGPPST